MRPGPRAPFELGVRLAALALGVFAWRAGGAWAGALVPLAAITLLRMPRRRLALELAAALGVLGIVPAGVLLPPLVAGAMTLALCALAPERTRLRLNGMDRFFVVQDYPGVPMNSHVWVELDRGLERAALERAVVALHAEVPILRSFVRETMLGVERFEARRPFAAAARLLKWCEQPIDEDLVAVLHAPFDLRREPPFRVGHAPRAGGGAVLLMTLHHCACDGEGLFTTLDWLLQRYDEAVRGVPAVPLALTREGIRFRDAPAIRERGRRWLWQMMRRHLRPTAKVGVRNASMFDDEQATVGHARHVTARLSPETWERLGAAASGERTRNDLLVAAALRAADAYCRGRGRANRPFRIMLPINLRQQLGLGPGLQNFLGVLPAHFDLAEVRRADLPDVVHARVRETRVLEEAVETPINLGVFSALIPPPLMRRALRQRDADTESSFFSFLFSHMRTPEPRAIAGATIESLSIRGSLARRPGFGVALARERGGLAVTVEYFYPLVRDASAKEFLERFAHEVDALLASPG